jgi:DNA-binding beta-propeller fold protein YncE
MIIGLGNNKYEWIEDWVKIPDTPGGHLNGRTHGIVITHDNNIIIFNQANPAILIFNSNGELLNTWGNRFSGAHGLTLTKSNGNEYLWLTDEFSGEVIKTTLEGVAVLNIEKPALDIYRANKYSPTWIAEFEEVNHGNGDIWIADGYGSNLVHRYDINGNFIMTLTGDEGAGKFNCPHSLFIDYRKNEPELYIADRGNKRFQVYDLDGKFIRVFGDDFLGCPCGGVVKNDLLYVPELCARIAILDENDNLICYLGQNEETCNIPTWPNHPKELIQSGKFNSPHHLAVDDENNIYIVEWIIGGRIIKLKKII